MGLDIYVMPLWRFKAGDFETALETELEIESRVITSSGEFLRRNKVSWVTRWKAKRQVSAIRRSVEARNDVPICWDDEGATVYSVQAWYGLQPLKAYTRWLDCRDRISEFEPPPEGDYGKHPALRLEVQRPTCRQMIEHDWHAGFYLPCDFEHQVEVEPYLILGYYPASRSVGSTVRLLGELDFVQKYLQVPRNYTYPEDDPLLPVRVGYLHLRGAAESSMKHRLPIIFCG